MNDARMTKIRGSLGATLAVALLCALSLSCLGCENALAAEAAALQDKAVSPVLSVKLPDASALKSGGSLAFGAISVGASSDIALTIKNTGVQMLSIDLAGIKVHARTPPPPRASFPWAPRPPRR